MFSEEQPAGARGPGRLHWSVAAAQRRPSIEIERNRESSTSSNCGASCHTHTCFIFCVCRNPTDRRGEPGANTRMDSKEMDLSPLTTNETSNELELKSKVYLRHTQTHVAVSTLRSSRVSGPRDDAMVVDEARVERRSPDKRVAGSGPEGHRHRRHPRERVREAPEGVHFMPHAHKPCTCKPCTRMHTKERVSPGSTRAN